MQPFGQVIGHRGAAAYAPENTLASFRKAKELGAQCVEFDVLLTRCGETIVFHDDTLQRTTDGRGKIRELDYACITRLDAGSWFSPQFQGEKIPRLQDAIHCLLALGLHANIEIKSHPATHLNIAQAVLASLAQYWPTNVDSPLISSFDHDCLRIIRQHHAALKLGLLYSTWDPNWQQLADELHCFSIHCNYKHLNQQRIKAIKDTGRAVLAYTVNSKVQALKLLDLGVDAVFSDYPDLLK